MANVTRTRETENLLVLMREQMVCKEGIVYNTKYEGQPTAGAVKVPVRDGEVAIQEYDKVTGAPLTQSTTTWDTILIDKDYVINELIDGYEAVAVPASLKAQRIDSASYTMAKNKDAYILNMMATQGTVTDVSSVTSIYQKVLKLRTAFVKGTKRNGVAGAFLMVTSDIYAEMLSDPNFIKSGDLSQELVAKGVVGQIAGFNVIECNSMGNKIDMIAGHPDYVTYVGEFSVPVSVKDLADGKHVGASAVQGREVYGGKVLRKAGVLVVKQA